MKSLLKCPPDTRFDFKTHDESLLQRASIDEQRRERATNNRATRQNDSNPSRQFQDDQRL